MITITGTTGILLHPVKSAARMDMIHPVMRAVRPTTEIITIMVRASTACSCRRIGTGNAGLPHHTR